MEQKEVPWICVTLVLLAIAFVGYFTPSTTPLSGALVYRDYGYGGGYNDGFSFTSTDIFGYGMSMTVFYEQYHIFIDAIIFLLIFLSIGQAVFMKHFSTGGKTLYIAVGLALTLGLMLWEEQTGKYIIPNLGIYSVIVLFLILSIGAFKAAYHATGKRPIFSTIAGVIVVLLLLFFINKIFPEIGSGISEFFEGLFTGISTVVSDIFGGNIAFARGGALFLFLLTACGIYLLVRAWIKWLERRHT